MYSINMTLIESVIVAPDAAANDSFGKSCKIDGDRAIVGASGKAVGGKLQAGSAYILELDESTGLWSVPSTGVLVAPSGAANDFFGYSSGLSGDRAIVGAYGRDPSGKSGAGIAYIYERDVSTGAWSVPATGTLLAADGATGDNFGWSSGISGDRAIVGSHTKTVSSQTQAGAAYICERDVTTGAWAFPATGALTAPVPTASQRFGASVSIDGSMAIVGAYGVGTGNAYIYERNVATGAWELSPTGTLVPSDGTSGDQFGFHVDIYGDFAIVGARSKTVSGVTGVGGAYVYERDTATGAWSLASGGIITAPDGLATDNFGAKVGISGNRAVVSATGKDPSGKNLGGGAYAFERNATTGTWEISPSGVIVPSDQAAGDLFGESVSVSGDRALVGAMFKDPMSLSSAGGAYVYEILPEGFLTVVSAQPTSAEVGVSIAGIGFADFSYVLSKSDANSNGAVMIDCGTVAAQNAQQTVAVSDLTPGSTVYLWVRALKGGVYTVISSGLELSVPDLPPSGGSITVTSAALTTAEVEVSIGVLGSNSGTSYVLSRASTDSSGALMVDCGSVIAQTASQTVTVSGLSPVTTYYFFVRALIDGIYTVISSGAVCTTSIPEFNVAEAGATRVFLSWTASSASATYQLEYVEPVSGETRRNASTSLTSGSITGLTPLGTYTFTVIDAKNGGIVARSTVTLPADVYSKTSLQVVNAYGSVTYDLSELTSTSVNDLLETVFVNGDVISLQKIVNGQTKDVEATVVKSGNSAILSGDSALAIENLEFGEQVTIVAGGVSLVVEDVTDSGITVDGIFHPVGSTFFVGSNRMHVT
jgi:FG-GAP repeat